MNLGVRFSTANRSLALEFSRAMSFWATILDMNWHEEDSQDCSIGIVDGIRDLFRPAEVARAQFPDSRTFQGWIAFNPNVSLIANEQYVISVHELGHMFGLPHNPSAGSVMFFLRMEGPVLVDQIDLVALAARHKLLVSTLDMPLLVSIPKSHYAQKGNAIRTRSAAESRPSTNPRSSILEPYQTH